MSAGPYRAEFGAIYHEDAPGFLFTVSPAATAEHLARLLNNRVIRPAPVASGGQHSSGEDRCAACGGKGYVEDEGGEGEGYPSKPEIEACACTAPARPEAPVAETAGEKCATCPKTANPAHYCDQHQGGPWCDDCWKVGDCASIHGEGCHTVVFGTKHAPVASRDDDKLREIEELISACEADFCSPATEGGSWSYGEGDDSEVAYPKSNITFGHIRRARQALAALKAAHSADDAAPDAG